MTDRLKQHLFAFGMTLAVTSIGWAMIAGFATEVGPIGLIASLPLIAFSLLPYWFFYEMIGIEMRWNRD